CTEGVKRAVRKDAPDDTAEVLFLHSCPLPSTTTRRESGKTRLSITRAQESTGPETIRIGERARRGGEPGADMAQANISVTESQFRCPICLDILKDPVSTPCGHTYCMSCINNYWDRADSAHFGCPQCRETFSPRPVLRRNTVLAEVVAKLKLSEAVTAPELYLWGVGDVPCDFCPAESKLRAAKSCLVCLATASDWSRRGGAPEAGTAGDWSGDCLLCEADQEEAHCVDAQRARRQLQLQECQRMIQGRTRCGERELEEFQQSLESLKVSASAVLEDSEALFADMALRLEKTKAEVRARLEAKERAVVGRAERDVEMLEKDLEELRRRDEEIGQLLQTEDNAHFLQREREERREREGGEREGGCAMWKKRQKREGELKSGEKDGRKQTSRFSQQSYEYLQFFVTLRLKRSACRRVMEEEDRMKERAAPLLCVPLATGRHCRALSLPTEAFSGARRALCHLRSRMEEVCREEVDKISRAVNENYVAGGECVKGGGNAENSKPQQTSAGQQTSGAVPVSFPLTSLSLQPADQRMRAVFLRFACHLSLDPDTAHPTLVLLEGPQGAHCGEEPQTYPPHPQRFDSVAQVLCREGQFGGANYWEVEWRGGGYVDIGVTYRGIGRKGGGKPCLLGRKLTRTRGG
ncbi:hypothetical protein L3Q82_020005, partial [Scortum barcoo]